MSLIYKVVAKGDPRDKNLPKKFYARLKSIGQKQEKEVAKLLSDETTLNPKEAEMALSQFQKILLRLLLDGHSVQLGDWGSFRLTCNSEGNEEAEKVTANSIKNLNIRFQPGKDLKEQIAKATFVSVDSLV